MKTTKKPEAAQWPDERDYEPVRSLIAEACRNQNLINEVVTWKNAFVLFKQCERRLGLPENDPERKAYLAIVRDLRAAGNRLVGDVEKNDVDIEAIIGMRLSALRACVEELEIDEEGVEFARNPEAVARFERYFAAK
jgi:hypothetical protein